MLEKSLPMNSQLVRYIEDHALREHPKLHALRREMESHPSGGYQISADQGAFMRFLVAMLGARRILELGTFTGYSSTAMALALPEDGTMVCLDVSEEFTARAQHLWAETGIAHKVDLRIAPALDSLAALKAEGKTFDLVFIDADKPNYPHYYEACLDLMEPGGVMLLDNTLWSGKVADYANQEEDTQMFRALTVKMRDDERVDFCMLAIADGIAMVRKRS